MEELIALARQHTEFYNGSFTPLDQSVEEIELERVTVCEEMEEIISGWCKIFSEKFLFIHDARDLIPCCGLDGGCRIDRAYILLINETFSFGADCRFCVDCEYDLNTERFLGATYEEFEQIMTAPGQEFTTRQINQTTTNAAITNSMF